MSLKSADPIMNRTQAISIERIHTLLTLLAHRNQAHLLQYAQMLRDSRLRQPERHHDRSHREAAPPRQEINDLPPPRLRNGVEDIRGRRCTCHTAIIFPYKNMSTAKTGRRVPSATRRWREMNLTCACLGLAKPDPVRYVFRTSFICPHISFIGAPFSQPVPSTSRATGDEVLG